jgi:hypothetical protein
MNLSYIEAKNNCLEILSTIYIHNGLLVIDWHNTTWDKTGYFDYVTIYESLLSNCSKMNFWISNCKEVATWWMEREKLKIKRIVRYSKEILMEIFSETDLRSLVIELFVDKEPKSIIKNVVLNNSIKMEYKQLSENDYLIYSKEIIQKGDHSISVELT